MASIEKEKLGIIYFRRDLRLEDNTALNKCIEENEYILPVFIFDNAQIHEKKNKYYNDKAFSLLRHFLYDLNQQFMKKFKTDFPINTHEGDPTDILFKMLEKLKKFDITVYFNMDFTPFALQRDTNIFIKLANHAIVKAYCDHLLVKVDQLTEITNYKNLYLNDAKDIYKKFSSFYKFYSPRRIDQPHTSTKKIKHHIIDDGFHSSAMLEHKTKYSFIEKYDRQDALKILSNNINYKNTRDDVSNETGTFHISHYLKFGVISIREAYHAFKNFNNNPAVRQLYWRDFYTLIAWANPKLLGWHFDGFNDKTPKWKQLKENSALYDKYNNIKWSYDKKIIEAWETGNTGFPIVDAGMRQLLKTGYMHNRARLITASFLTKICGIDWRVGEMWFAKHLIDYDPIINNGNWLWVAGGGADSQPYFRVFNPWLQQKEHDPLAIYVKRWVPELEKTDIKIIYKYYEYPKIKNYASPIINYTDKKNQTLELYKSGINK
jgi:deoxyribodipyrimidine photo-lyase